MKKIIVSLLVVFMLPFSLFSQEDTKDNSNDFNKWKMRFRLISVIPDVSVDHNETDGADIAISTAFIPELDFTYFFTENWAAELILATTKHNVDIEVSGNKVADLGHVWLLPPTLSLQYHFTGGAVTPYLGAGVNYTIFYGVDSGDLDSLDYENSVGFSFQGGLDYDLDDKWFLNLDIKKLFLNTDVTANGSSSSIGVDINPLIVGLGVGMRF